MNTIQTGINRCWTMIRKPWFLTISQVVVLVVAATALLWPAPFTSDKLFAVWSWSDLVVSHWPTALLIQRTFTQSHRLPLWNSYWGGGLPLALILWPRFSIHQRIWSSSFRCAITISSSSWHT